MMRPCIHLGEVCWALCMGNVAITTSPTTRCRSSPSFQLFPYVSLLKSCRMWKTSMPELLVLSALGAIGADCTGSGGGTDFRCSGSVFAACTQGSLRQAACLAGGAQLHCHRDASSAGAGLAVWPPAVN